MNIPMKCGHKSDCYTLIAGEPETKRPLCMDCICDEVESVAKEEDAVCATCNIDYE